MWALKSKASMARLRFILICSDRALNRLGDSVGVFVDLVELPAFYQEPDFRFGPGVTEQHAALAGELRGMLRSGREAEYVVGRDDGGVTDRRRIGIVELIAEDRYEPGKIYVGVGSVAGEDQVGEDLRERLIGARRIFAQEWIREIGERVFPGEQIIEGCGVELGREVKPGEDRAPAPRRCARTTARKSSKPHRRTARCPRVRTWAVSVRRPVPRPAT